ncbi:MAG: SAM-dependent methyltransferase [Actinobacteria bacterium]|nr:SAM-dependent methyltransferase [Actinomycetota bacterium]
MSSSTQFTTVTTEGGLLPGDLISRLVNDTSSLPGARAQDYRITPGRELREIINRSWNDMLGAWQVFAPQVARLSPDDHTATLTWDRWLLPLFAELGYGRLDRFAEAVRVGDKDYPVSHHHEHALVHLVGWNVRLDRRTAGVTGAARAAPYSMVQELLNRTDDHLWAILSNGHQLRILRDNSSLTRAAYVEFDLEQIFTEGVFTDFAALWLLVHASRVEGDPQDRCWLEQWAAEAREQGVRALDTLGQGFADAITTLGQGFLAHPANTALRERLADGVLSTQDYYRQLLRLVYRLVFLLVAEDRDLLHPPDASPTAKDRYARYYSLSRIREIARRHRGTKHSDLWDQALVVIRSLGPDGQPELGLPGLNSGLWALDATPDLNGARLTNASFLAALRFVAYREQDRALHRIDYRHLGSEELGSVYESLLELHPEVDQSAATFSLGHAAGNERKTTGSYYTPTSLISALLDSALDPVLDDAEHALRQVIGRCIFGVDLNPMAVELCKVSLWLESVEPGKPLSFLDHHIVWGNSLLGATPELVEAGIPDDAYRALTGDDKTVVSSMKKRNKAERAGASELPLWGAAAPADTLATAMVALDSIPDADPDDIAEKEERWRALVASDAMMRATFAADAWCASFVAPKVVGVPAITSDVVRRAGEGGQAAVDPEVVALVRAMASEYRFCHLHLVFPQVFDTGPDRVDLAEPGGFDVVLGNPPWEKVQMKEQEFFATRDPAIAAAAGAARKRMVADLALTDPDLFAAFQGALHHAEAESAVLRSSGRFPLNGRGQINTYAVFAELMRSVTGPIGRCGAIVPSGIATDDTTKVFFGDVVTAKSLVSLYDFENRDGLFPAVDSRTKFCLLTLSGQERPVEVADFAFFAQRTEELADDGRRFTLSTDELSLVNPNTRTCPIFRSRRDAELTLAAYRQVPVLVAEGPPGVNPWGITFRQGLFNMTNDSGLFRTAAQCEADGAALCGNTYRHPDGRTWHPLYEGKMVHHFDHRWASYEAGDFSDFPLSCKQDPNSLPLPRYWVDAERVDERLVGGDGDHGERTWLLGFRDICRSTDERTVIASVIPRAAVGNKLPLLLADAQPGRVALLGASLTSFALDYVARQKVGGVTLNFFIVKQLPVLPPATYDRPCPWNPKHAVAEWLTPRVLELTYTATDLAGFARDLGWDGPPFRWDPERRAVLRAELDACFFHLYGFGRDDVEYIMDTFSIVRRKDEAAYGEYRTAGMILDAYDTMAQGVKA